MAITIGKSETCQEPSAGILTTFLNLFTPIVPYHTSKCRQLSEPTPAIQTQAELTSRGHKAPTATTIANNNTYCQANARYQVVFLWVVTTLLVLAAGLFHNLFPVLQFAHPNDIRYHYPYFKESINSVVCFFLGAGLPLGVLMLPYILNTTDPVTIQKKYNIKNDGASTPRVEQIQYGRTNPNKVQTTVATASSSTTTTHDVQRTTWLQGIFSSSVLGGFVALGLGTFLTTLFKTIVGRPRPNALALTRHIYTKYNINQDKIDILQRILSTSSSLFGFAPSTTTTTTTATSLMTTPVTTTTATAAHVVDFFTNTPHLLSNILANDALRSFPSGHSCFAFAGMIYLSLILYTRYLKTVRFATQSQHTDAPLKIVITPRAVLNAVLYPIDYDRIKSLHCCYHAPSTQSRGVEAPRHGHGDSSPTPSEGLQTPRVQSLYGEELGGEEEMGEVSPLLSRAGTKLPASHHATKTTTSHPNGFTGEIHLPPLALAMICYIVLPIIMAGLIAISRIIDFWHHPDDVLAGSVLGTCCAFLTYRIINY